MSLQTVNIDKTTILSGKPARSNYQTPPLISFPVTLTVSDTLFPPLSLSRCSFQKDNLMEQSDIPIKQHR